MKRESVYCYRVYDADLPDYAVAIDFYSSADAVESPFVCIQEYEAPSSVDPRKAKRRLREVRSIVQKEFGLDEDHLFLKTRSRQRGASQYEKTGDSKTYHEVTEGSCRLLVNFEDYLDTGLFLDHRPVRTRIFAEARGKHFLNLFCYTGAATVHAALGGAASSTSVDLSNTYLDWARRNLLANKVDLSKHDLVQADCLDWLQSTKGAYDLIFLDPPTFSNSKRMQDTLDIQRDHVALIQASMRLLAPGGTLYFSTNLRSFRLDSTIESAFSVEDISKATIPNDFKRRQNIHRCFRIRLASD